MKHSPKLSYQDYRAACNEAYTANISNPSVFYNPTDGFYAAPSSDLVPNADSCLGLAYYSANSGDRSFTGNRREFRPIAAAIREFYAMVAVSERITLKMLIDGYKSADEWRRENI